MKKLLFSVLFIITALSTWAQEPLKLPALSPTARVSQDFSLSTIDLTYSRPSMRGRKIFGDLVPYGKVWRTGANSATKIKFGEDVVIGGESVKAGEYALYTIPGEDKWEIILNKGVGNWGTNGYDNATDVARFFIKPSTMEKAVQTFTIEIGAITYSSCKLELMWENTKVAIPIKVSNEDKISTNIDKAINHPAQPPYFQVANYYFETEQNLDKAEMYVDKALEANPDAYYMWYLRARIQKRLGHKSEAVASATKSMMCAKGTAFEDEYRRNNQKLIDSMK